MKNLSKQDSKFIDVLCYKQNIKLMTLARPFYMDFTIPWLIAVISNYQKN